MVENDTGQPKIDLSSEIGAIINSGQIEPQKSAWEILKEQKKKEEERQKQREGFLESENLKHNEELKRRVHETGIVEIFSEAREALSKFYPSATLVERWGNAEEVEELGNNLRASRSPGSVNRARFHREITNKHIDDFYQIQLAWKNSADDTIPVNTDEFYRNEYYYAEARYDNFRRILYFANHEFTVEELQDTEKLKVAMVYHIQNPRLNERIEPPSPPRSSDYRGPLDASRFHGGG